MPTMLTYIAGAPYHEGARDAIAKLRTAVAVHAADGTKLGYVPRVDAGTATVELLDAPRGGEDATIEPTHFASSTRH